MEFKVYRTWDWENETKMKFDSLEELLEFTKKKQQEKGVALEDKNTTFSDYITTTKIEWEE